MVIIDEESASRGYKSRTRISAKCELQGFVVNTMELVE